MFNTIIIENFFDNFCTLENEFKKIPLFSINDYKNTSGVTWPGKRSDSLFKSNIFLWQLVVKEIMQKSESEKLKYKSWNAHSVIHLRLDEDNEKDFIHTDPDDLTIIIFLSKTNLNSGLNLYNEEKQETVNIKFVQNRAVIFDSKRFHKSSLNFGENIDNGRLTLNCFINFTSENTK
jgi:hypothetical protein